MVATSAASCWAWAAGGGPARMLFAIPAVRLRSLGRGVRLCREPVFAEIFIAKTAV